MNDANGVLVLGATSLVGRYLVPRLVAEGMAPAAVSRAPPPETSSGVKWIAADLTDPDLARRLPPAATVFSLMPIWLLPAALPALTAGGMRRLVAFSSTSRFTKTGSPDAAERETARRLADGEAQAVAACEAAGAAWTILRPTLIYAEGQDGNVSRLAGLIRRFGVLPLAGRGAGLRQPVHAEDLAAGAAAAAKAAAASGRAYDLPGGETLSYRAMAVRIFEALGRRPAIVSIPPAAWKAGLALASPFLPGATAGMGVRMAEDLTFDAGPAARDFGWAPRDFRPRFRS